MESIKRLPSPVRFGVFELDLQSGELRRQGVKVKLQEQPFRVLLVLLERPGEVVTREELQKRLWPADTFVDFEPGLNRAINKLREALNDDSESPRFIETLPRRGYRFLAPIEMPVAPALAPSEEAGGGNPIEAPPSEHPHPAEHTVLTAAMLRPILWWSVTAALAVVAGLAEWRLWRSPTITPDRPLQQLDLDVGPDDFSQPVISPDGTRIVVVSKGALTIRRLDQARESPIAGTEGAYYPSFSPNGQWIAFFAAGKLQKIAVDGGAPIILCDAPHAAGASWGPDDYIVATLNFDEGISRVPAAGGTPRLVTDAKGDAASPLHFWPQVLPDGKSVLFAATNARGGFQGSLRILTLKSGKVKTLIQNSTYGRYLAGGYLVYYRRGTVFASPMDVDRLELTGQAIPLAYGVSNTRQGRADFDLSSSGTMIYRGGAAGTMFAASWLYASGKIEPVLRNPGNYFTPRLSPDGKRLGLSVIAEGKQNLWVYDFSRETLSRLTSDAEAALLPTWTPDGEFLAFRLGNALAWKRSDGSGTVNRLSGVSTDAGPWSFSADGKWLAFWPLQPDSDLWIAPVEHTPTSLRVGRPQPLLQETGAKGAPAISPDNRWVAYTSNVTGRFEIYVMPFSPGSTAKGGRWQVSNGGGTAPIWSHDGRELFYQSLDRQIQVAAYTVKGHIFSAEKPRVWSERRLGDTSIFAAFDVAPEGSRVLALLPAEGATRQTLVRVLLNVDAEMRRRESTQTR